MTFGEKIRKLRLDRGLTQRQVAEALNISVRALVYYETGKRLPPQTILNQFREYFQISADALIIDQKEPSLWGAHEQLPPHEILQQVGSLLAGGQLSEEDRALFLDALDTIRLSAQARQHSSSDPQ